MTRRNTIWLAVAGVFTLVNVGSVVYAAVLGEVAHSGVHVVLSVVGLFWMARLKPRGRPADLPHVAAVDDRVEQLQQSVDAVALEVERIGEAQRFRDKLRAEKVEARR